MSRIINPILLRETPGTATGPLSAARIKASATTSSTPTFAQQLTAAQTQGLQKTASIATTPQTTANPSAATGSDKIDSTEQAAPSDSSSWRVDRRAAEVGDDVDDFSFEDFIDVINPLQHIPVLSTVYREMTGDEIKPVSQVAGGVLFGILTGSILISALASIASAAYEQKTGEEPTMEVADALFGIKSNKGANETMLADAGAGNVPAPSDQTALTSPTNAPVTVAALEEPVKAAPTALPATASNKQPYGGVMDTAAGARNKRLAANATPTPTLASGQGVKIGDTIYTSQYMSNASRKTALQAAKAAAEAKKTAQAATALTATAPPKTSSQLSSITAPSSVISVPGQTTTADEKKLGQMMRQSADASASGNTLPPDLVHDMMLMALDKYKTAGNLSPSEMPIATP